MPINAEYATYEHTKTEIFKAQTVVESRLSGVGEILSVPAVKATASLDFSECLSGEIRYGGKVLFGIVAEGLEKNVTRIEKGAEFTHRTPKEGLTPSSVVQAELAVISTTVRREGGVFVVSCVLEAEFSLLVPVTLSCLSGGEGVIVKKQETTLYTLERTKGEGEVEDEFTAELISDVLLHGENIGAVRAETTEGGINVEGEVGVNICCVRGDMPGNLERLLPFKAFLPCTSKVESGMPCKVRAHVAFAEVNLRSDEETGSSTVSLSVRLSFTGEVSVPTPVSLALDAFSTESELTLEYAEAECVVPCQERGDTRRVTGKVALSEKIDFSTVFEALVCHKAEAELYGGKNGESELRGAVSAVLLVRDGNGSHRGIGVELPFILPYGSVGAGISRVDILVLGMSLRQKNEGEADGEVTLRINVEREEKRTVRYVKSVVEGEKITPSHSAFSVFLPREGDGAWEIAKALHRPVEDVISGNPTLTFPVKKGERIIIYRQKR